MTRIRNEEEAVRALVRVADLLVKVNRPGGVTSGQVLSGLVDLNRLEEYVMNGRQDKRRR